VCTAALRRNPNDEKVQAALDKAESMSGDTAKAAGDAAGKAGDALGR